MPQVGIALAAYVASALTMAGIGAETAGTIAWITVSIAEMAAVTLATTALSSLIAGRPSFGNDKQVQTIRQAVAPRRKYYGLVKASGVYAFLKASDGYLYQNIMICQGPINQFVDHYFGDEVLTLDGSGYVTVPTRFVRSGGNFGQILTRFGDASSTVYSELTSAFTGWDSNHHLNGIATALVILRSEDANSFTKLYPSGLQPYTAVIEAAKVWDPRDDAQDPDDLTTWVYSDNGVLQLLDYCWSDDGMRIPRALIELGIDVWQAEADLADDTVTLKAGGSEKRWSLGGGYELTEPPKTVLPRFLTPMDARLSLRGDGAVIPDTGKYTAPTVTLDDSCIVAYSGFARALPAGDVKNEIRAQFVSADYGFIQQDADPWRNEDSIDVDGDQSLTMANMDWCRSHSQARRRMKIEAYRQCPAWAGTIITNAYGLKAIGERFVQVQISELSIDLSFEIQKWSLNAQNGNCTFTLVAMPSDAYDWDPDADEGTAPAKADPIGDNTTENLDDLNIDLEASVMVASWTAPTIISDSAEAAWRTHDTMVSDDDATWNNMTVTGNTARSGPVVSGSYDVRAHFVSSSGVDGDYSYERGVIVT